MPRFACTVCGSDFDVPQPVLDKFVGWQPKYCRDHSPKKKTKPTPRTNGRRGPEENLTSSEVLARHVGGPQSGVFTDGSAIPNPGPGGWGMVWVEGGEIRAAAHGFSEHTTNNRMELQALIEAYKALPEEAETIIHSDSRLCVDTITRWAPGWERKGWKKKGGEIKNLAQVQELLRLYRAHPGCTLKWIESHSGHRWNEYADCLATAWMRDEV